MTVAPIDLRLEGAVAYWYRNLAVFRRIWLLGMMAWFIEPVLYLVAMGTGLGSYLEGIRGRSYIDFIAPGLLGVAAMYGANFEATWNTWFKMDRSRVYEAVSSTPVSIPDVALGEVMWATTRATIYGSSFAVVATAFGVYRSWWGLLTIPALALVGLVFAISGLIFTYSITRVDYIAYYWTMFMTPMFLFSGIFFPLDRLPQWLQTIAWCMPLHHATNLMRSLMSDGDPVRAAGSALWLLVAAVTSIWIPIVILRRRFVV